VSQVTQAPRVFGTTLSCVADLSLEPRCRSSRTISGKWAGDSRGFRRSGYEPLGLDGEAPFGTFDHRLGGCPDGRAISDLDQSIGTPAGFLDREGHVVPASKRKLRPAVLRKVRGLFFPLRR
jgi:hypothetical protein